MHLKKRPYHVNGIHGEAVWLYSPSRFQPWSLTMAQPAALSVSLDWKGWLADTLLGHPTTRFIFEREGLLIATKADRWQVKHGYLEKCFPDGVREDITQPILLFQNTMEPEETFYICPSVTFRMSYLDIIKTHQIEQGAW